MGIIIWISVDMMVRWTVELCVPNTKTSTTNMPSVMGEVALSYSNNWGRLNVFAAWSYVLVFLCLCFMCQDPNCVAALVKWMRPLLLFTQSLCPLNMTANQALLTSKTKIKKTIKEEKLCRLTNQKKKVVVHPLTEQGRFKLLIFLDTTSDLISPHEVDMAYIWQTLSDYCLLLQVTLSSSRLLLLETMLSGETEWGDSTRQLWTIKPKQRAEKC